MQGEKEKKLGTQKQLQEGKRCCKVTKKHNRCQYIQVTIHYILTSTTLFIITVSGVEDKPDDIQLQMIQNSKNFKINRIKMSTSCTSSVILLTASEFPEETTLVLRRYAHRIRYLSCSNLYSVFILPHG